MKALAVLTLSLGLVAASPRHASIAARKAKEAELEAREYCGHEGTCIFPSAPDQNVADQLYSIAKGRKVSDRVMLAMFETALVESGCTNIECGDQDSIGVFQQRPGVGAWGSCSQILNVTHATNAFLDVAVQYSNSNPGAGPGTIAQGTQRSEVPDAYDKAEGRARDLLSKTAARAGSGSSSSGGTTNVGSNPSSGSSSSSGCTMATTKAGDTGNVFASRNGVSWAQVVSLNPGLNSSGNNLVANKAYCVKKGSTSTSGGTTNVGSNPSSGSTSSSACTMATVKPGDTGNVFASRNGVSWAQIVSLNPGLNSSGNNLVANKAYCVGKSNGSTNSSTSGGTTNVGSNPSSAKCSKKATVKAGDSGSTFASRNGLTYAQLRTFNPTLNAGGTNLTAGGSYCLN